MTTIPNLLGVFRRGAAILLAPGLISACSNRIDSGDQLTGTWADATAQFSASASAIEYVAPCIRAEFLPVAADSSPAFTIESTSLTVTGNIRTGPDTRLEIQGRFIGDSLQVQTRLIQLPLGVNDPIVFMLPPGQLRSVPVCTA